MVLAPYLTVTDESSRLRFSGLGVRERWRGAGSDIPDLEGVARRVAAEVLISGLLIVFGAEALPRVGVPSIGVRGALNVFVEARKAL